MDYQKQAKRLVEQDSYEVTCMNCAFCPREGPLCFAPWSDWGIEEEGIDPCFEGIYYFLSGTPGDHLAKRIPAGVWARKRGEDDLIWRTEA